MGTTSTAALADQKSYSTLVARLLPWHISLAGLGFGDVLFNALSDFVPGVTQALGVTE